MTNVDAVKKIIGSDSITENEFDNVFEDLYNYFLNSGEMPYGVAKARTGDPMNWVFEQLDGMGLIKD